MELKDIKNLKEEDLSLIPVKKTERIEEKQQKPPNRRHKRRGGEKYYRADNSNLSRALNKLRKSSSNFKVKLSFVFDEESQEVMVKILDGESGKVVRTFSPDDVLEMVENNEDYRGLLFNRKA